MHRSYRLVIQHDAPGVQSKPIAHNRHHYSDVCPLAADITTKPADRDAHLQTVNISPHHNNADR